MCFEYFSLWRNTTHSIEKQQKYASLNDTWDVDTWYLPSNQDLNKRGRYNPWPIFKWLMSFSTVTFFLFKYWAQAVDAFLGHFAVQKDLVKHLQKLKMIMNAYVIIDNTLMEDFSDLSIKYEEDFYNNHNLLIIHMTLTWIFRN